MKDDSTFEQLPPTKVLAGFDDEDRRKLSSYGKFLVFKAEQTVIREGEDQDCLYFLIKGMLHALHKVKGGFTPVGAINADEWFGEINIFDPHSASAMVKARMDSQVWRISRPKLEKFLNNYPTLGSQLLLSVSEVLARRSRNLLTKLNATWEISW